MTGRSDVGVTTAPSACARLAVAREWLARRSTSAPLLIVAPTTQAADDLVYHWLHGRAPDAAAQPPGNGHGRAVFGWHRMTPAQLAGKLAGPSLTARNLVPVGPLGTQAAIARAIDLLRDQDALGRYQRVAHTPGFARAVARTLNELRLSDVDEARVAALDPALAAMAGALSDVLTGAGLIDWPGVIECASGLLESDRFVHELIGLPTLVLDPTLDTPAECRFLGAVLGLAQDPMITLPATPDTDLPVPGLAALRWREVAAGADSAASAVTSATARLLERLQTNLFAASESGSPSDASAGGVEPAGDDDDEAPAPTTLDLFSTPAPSPAPEPAASLRVFSAPGESRECIEIVRAIRDHAAQGVAFDDMAVLLRAPEQYRAHLEEAFHRADIPAWFARGAVRPDPAGRAFIALLHCAREQFSAHRFAEYLSLGEVPAADAAGAPPPPAEDWIAPDPQMTAIPGLPAAEQIVALQGDAEEYAADVAPEGAGDAADPVVDGRLRAPRRWEQLLHEAAVIGGYDRWERRLDGLAAQMRLARDEVTEDDEVRGETLDRGLEDLGHLRAFALPLIAQLSALPEAARWGEWLDMLAALATRSLRMPARVLAVLSELRPMAAVGPVSLDDVINVLSDRLRSLPEPPPRSRYGRVFVAPVEVARGHAFEVVFVPGLAEKLFPQKISEDPILLDERRRALGATLRTNDERIGEERMALRLAVSAARREVVLSYPRIDMEQGRPRVASFYSLEAIRAAEGRLLDFESLASRAELETGARIGWPAPADPQQAIDEAEHDLALLDALLHLDEQRAVGAARYLIGVNPHLGRALRFRARRWLRRWTPADGLIGPLSEAASRALRSHGFDQRTYSPTALQNFAQCPYKFLLYAIHKLGTRDAPVAIDEMDPLERGSLVHDVQFHLLTRLRDDALLPVRSENLEQVLVLLDAVIDSVSASYHDRLAPAIERVWADGIAGIRADLREWLRRMSEDDSGWVPWAFELAFGLPDVAQRDERSVPDGIALDCGITLRGSIDLIERRADGQLRVTDHKTGRKVAEKHQVIGGGEHLQPVLYAEAAARLFAEQGEVVSGRLYYCTARGEFADHEVAFDERAQLAARRVTDTITTAMAEQFLPAAPRRKRWSACDYCDYRVICGPYEDERVKRKPEQELAPLVALREVP